MKDYSLSKEEAKNFILNYEITSDNKIIINLADDKEYIVPYTIENEEKILEKMKMQVNCSTKFVDRLKILIISRLILIISCIILSLENLFYLFSGESTNLLLTKVAIGSLSSVVLNSLVGIILNKRRLNDVRKNKCFVVNENILNKKIKENTNILSNTNKKTKEIILSNNTQIKNKPLNINVIDKLTLAELKQILENIKLEDSLEFEYPEEEKEKIKTLNLSNKKKQS